MTQCTLTTLSINDQTPPGSAPSRCPEGAAVAQAAKTHGERNPTRLRRMLAADVGGTHARVGLVGQSPNGYGPVRVLSYRTYLCAEWPSLSAVLEDFVRSMAPEEPLLACAVASAGYVLGDAIVNDNLPWPVSIREIRERLGLAQLAVINDFEAVAYATQFLTRADTLSVIDNTAPAAAGPVLVMGPGTGLGSAVLLPGAHGPSVLATEAGQIALAPGNEREIAVLRILARERSHVSFEHALSGPGLINLYRALCELRGSAPTLTLPAEVTRSALARSDEAAVEALEMFCGLLGSFVGDLVLLYGARGGVFLAGGILPQIRELLLTSTFAARFFNKGVMHAYLQQVPVRLMEHGQHGVIGAAGLYLDGHSAELR